MAEVQKIWMVAVLFWIWWNHTPQSGSPQHLHPLCMKNSKILQSLGRPKNLRDLVPPQVMPLFFNEDRPASTWHVLKLTSGYKTTQLFVRPDLIGILCCRHRPSEKTAIHVGCVHPFSVATLKWGYEGATNRTLEACHVPWLSFLKNPVSYGYLTRLRENPKQKTKIFWFIRSGGPYIALAWTQKDSMRWLNTSRSRPLIRRQGRACWG